jgi:hypothetical protein
MTMTKNGLGGTRIPDPGAGGWRRIIPVFGNGNGNGLGLGFGLEVRWVGDPDPSIQHRREGGGPVPAPRIPDPGASPHYSRRSRIK